MEAYAITIELLATHFSKVETDLTYYGQPAIRNPGPHYTVALEFVLEHATAGGQSTTLKQYLSGQAPIDVYYLVAVISFAAMQLPVIQKRTGAVYINGNLATLCPAYRFILIVDALENGRIDKLPAAVRSAEARSALLDWLRASHNAIGDPITMQLYDAVQEAFDSDSKLQNMSQTSQSLIDLPWAARANFCMAPNEYVLGYAAFAEHYPCQPRYVRTSDGKLSFVGEQEAFRAQYVVEHAVPVLQSAIFAERWDSTWAKMPEISANERLESIKQSLWGIGFLSEDTDFWTKAVGADVFINL